jgi:hypothetical protein
MMFWFVLAILLTVSSTLNAYQFGAAEDGAVQLWRGGLSVALLLLGALSLRKGLAARSNDQEATPGAMAAARASRLGMIAVLAVVILIVIAISAGIAARGPSLSMPESMAGYARVHGPTFEELEQSIGSEVGGTYVVGVFGTPRQPRFVVAGFDSVPEPGTDTLSDFAKGLGSNGSSDISSRTTRSIGTVTYSCVPFSISPAASGTMPSTLCEWNDGKSYGFVANFDPALDASDLALEAYEAVVA